MPSRLILLEMHGRV